MMEERSPMYETLKLKYEKNFVRKDQLIRYVALGKITDEEYFLIIDEEYIS